MHSDNAKKFLGMRNILNKMGIEPTTTSARTLESSGMDKSVKRTFLAKARVLINKAGMLQQYWREAVDHEAYFHSRTSSRLLNIYNFSDEIILRKRPFVEQF